jgi:hypothetical protein
MVIMRSSGEILASEATRVLMSFRSASGLRRPAFDEGDVQDDQIIGVVHANERGRVAKAGPREFEDKLIEVLWRYA